MRVHSRRVVTPAGTIDATVSIADGRITALAPGHAGATVDVGDRRLIPGLIDTHVHGGGGAQCNTSSADEVAAVAAFHAAHGTTSLLATTVSADVDELEDSLRAIGEAGVLGAHLEGPFLNPRRPGAMDGESFLEPSTDVLDRLLGAGARVSMMTIAPEVPGALEIIAAMAARGTVVSLGHSEATDEMARAAVRAGARSVTHLFNAMPPLHHREPGLLGAALDDDVLQCELICDGVHVDPVAMRLALRAKGVGGLRLITDAIAAAGMGDGEYRLGEAPVVVRDGRATLARAGVRAGAGGGVGGGQWDAGDDGTADGTIAGSTLTMDAALANAVRFLGVTVEEAVALASTNPARLLGLGAAKGAIAVGYDADVVVLDAHLRACSTMIAGRWVGGREPPTSVF
jgi:N-acetylglucosamine-6-phosphate deacetylase